MGLTREEIEVALAQQASIDREQDALRKKMRNANLWPAIVAERGRSDFVYHFFLGFVFGGGFVFWLVKVLPHH